MSGKDSKRAKPNNNNSCKIKTLSDLNERSDSDSDSEDAQEYYTGGQESGMLVEDPFKGKPVIDALFERVRELSSLEEPNEPPQASSSKNFPGTGKRISGESVSNPPQQPENIVHDLVFWKNGFTVGGGPLRGYEDPENALFLESLKKSECPKELEPSNRNSTVQVSLVRRNENYQVKVQKNPQFQGVGRTLGSSSSSVSEPSTTSNPSPSVPEPSTTSNSYPSVHEPSTTDQSVANFQPSKGLAVDYSKPFTSVQLRLSDGTRMVVCLNHHHTVADIRAFISATSRGVAPSYKLQAMGFPPKPLDDPTQTIEEAGLMNSVIIQKL